MHRLSEDCDPHPNLIRVRVSSLVFVERNVRVRVRVRSDCDPHPNLVPRHMHCGQLCRRAVAQLQVP